MAKEWAKPFYNSKAWKDCSGSYKDHRMAIDGGMCEVCHRRPGYIVHHKILLTPQSIKDPEVALNWEHLRYECKICHDKEEGHGVGVKTEPVCSFDESGNPIEILPEYEHDRL